MLLSRRRPWYPATRRYSLRQASSWQAIFVLGDRELTIFLVLASTYGFTTAAMLVPAIAEFDIAMGRTKHQGEE